jgi:formiminotetrahydrofolate cyclodeaminase
MQKYSFEDMSVQTFIMELSGRSPTPGGGGASALAGAVGMALGGMVASLTISSEKYASVREEMQSLKVAAYRIQKELLALIDRDAEAFAPLAGAWRMPSETEEERAEKARVMEAALKEACLAPLEMMRKIAEAIDLLEVFARKGSVLAISDAACGAALCYGALRSAWMNVRINTKAMTDESFAERMLTEGSALLSKYEKLAGKIYGNVEKVFTR